jgi:hypothetical protein
MPTPFLFSKFDTMECIENALGLKGGCAELSSTQSVFINGSVTHGELAQIADGNETASVDDFFRERRSMAVREMIAEVQDHNRPSYVFKSIISNDVIGEETEDLDMSQVTGGRVGVSLKRRNPNTYLRYRITEIMLFLNTSGNVTVTAYDLDTGVTLASAVVATVAGQISTAYVEWNFKARNIAILYDSTGKQPFRTRLHGHGCSTCKGGGWVNCNSTVTGRATAVNNGDPVTNVTAKIAKDMGGMKVRYNVECDHETWLCSIRASLALPLLWKTAELVMEYGIFTTSRENRSTKLDRSQLEKRQSMYREKYAEAMARIFDTMNTPKDPFCFVCRRTSKYVTQLP